MPRRMSMMLMVVLVIQVMPSLAEAQDFEHAFIPGPRTPALGRVWSGLDFGARIVRPAAPAPVWRGRFDAPPPHESPWRHVPATQNRRGDLTRPRIIEVSPFGAPIDCAMAKPGDPTLDPKLVRPVPSHTVHSGVIIPVAPCRFK